MASTPPDEVVETNRLLQAITEMVRRLRKGSHRTGVILANGGFLSYQHAICLAVSPRKQGTSYPDSRRFESSPSEPIPPIDSEAEGRAVIEVRDTSPAFTSSLHACDAESVQTYTVEFGRDGNPQRAYVVGRLLDNNHRFLANHGDAKTLSQLSSTTQEPIGTIGAVRPDSTGGKGQRRNLFYLDDNSRL